LGYRWATLEACRRKHMMFKANSGGEGRESNPHETGARNDKADAIIWATLWATPAIYRTRKIVRFRREIKMVPVSGQTSNLGQTSPEAS
jgi:hypothetical protein